MSSEPSLPADRARRTFLQQMTGGAVAAGAIGAVPSGIWTEAAIDPGDLEMARRYESEQGQDRTSWDMSWVDRVTGKHRHVFDSHEIAEGAVLHQARTVIRGFTDVYGSTDGECSAVRVIRHAAIPMAANDRLWDELTLGKHFEQKDPESGKPARRNPFLNVNTPEGAKYGSIWPDGGLDTLIQR